MKIVDENKVIDGIQDAEPGFEKEYEDLDDNNENWDRGKTPHDLLGEVNATTFLRQLTVEVLQSQQKRYFLI